MERENIGKGSIEGEAVNTSLRMAPSVRPSDQEIIRSWERFVAQQPGFVGGALQLLRDNRNLTEAEQQNEFGIGSQGWSRLLAMPLPRADQYARDAHRIAQACGVQNEMAFVTALLMARGLEAGQQAAAGSQFEVYQAAFDARDDLDTLPETWVDEAGTDAAPAE